jgi:HAD superfamily hydrolase (TIGR01458 family)
MPSRAGALPPPDGSLSGTMAGARALLLDLDGVLVQVDRALPGAAAALAELDRRRLPYLIATNTSLMSRATLARRAAAVGIHLDASRIVSALSVTAALTARRFAGRPLYVLCSDDARTEFAGQWLLPTGDAAAAASAPPCAAVVISDAAEALTYAGLDEAFRLVRGGARLVAMHRNPWWLTARGPTLDAGAFVVGLEFATGRRALVAGKPARTFFAEAVRRLGHPAAEVVMVGDDLRTDVAGARRAGLRAVWVRSGRHGADDLARHAARGEPLPDAVADDLPAVVAALPQR